MRFPNLLRSKHPLCPLLFPPPREWLSSGFGLCISPVSSLTHRVAPRMPSLRTADAAYTPTWLQGPHQIVPRCFRSGSLPGTQIPTYTGRCSHSKDAGKCCDGGFTLTHRVSSWEGFLCLLWAPQSQWYKLESRHSQPWEKKCQILFT